MYDSLTQLFDDLLATKNIAIHYQPIFNLKTGDIYAFEALMRGGQSSPFRSPMELLTAAKKVGKLFELEMLSRELAITQATHLTSHQFLFINVDIEVITAPSYQTGITRTFLEQSSLSDNQIVIEITETSAIDDYTKYFQVIEHYKSQGYHIAIDDVGSGYSGLNRIAYTNPTFIKIDMDLVRNCHQDLIKQSLIKAMVNFAISSNMKAIAEGIECREELSTLIECGVHFAQGYYLGMPRPANSYTQLELMPHSQIRDKYRQLNRLELNSFDTVVLGDICIESPTLQSNQTCQNASDLFYRYDVEGLCVVDEKDHPQGLIMKHAYYSHIATQYGYSLYANRSITLIMDPYPLIMDISQTIKQVSEVVTLRSTAQVYDNIIVTKNGSYHGMVSVRDLLHHMTTLETNYAKHLNPLTSLPGNVLIHQMLEKYIGEDTVQSYCYFDLDHFKSYNDVYGFDHGDRLLKALADLIKSTLHNHTTNYFLGHIGGDDFTAIIDDTLEVTQRILEELVEKSHALCLKFFKPLDIERGYIQSKDRSNQTVKFPLTSLSAACYHGNLSQYQSVENVGEMMSLLKKHAKSIQGDSYCIYNQQLELICDYPMQIQDKSYRLHA